MDRDEQRRSVAAALRERLVAWNDLVDETERAGGAGTTERVRRWVDETERAMSACADDAADPEVAELLGLLRDVRARFAGVSHGA